MSRVLLVSSNTTRSPYPVHPLGIAVLAGALAARGHEVRQFDCLAEEKPETGLLRALDEFAPQFVGLSVRNIDNVDSHSSLEEWYLDDVRRWCARIRERSDAVVILGGPGFSLIPEAILEYVGADYGIVGEGERTLPQLLEDLAARRSIPGKIRRTENRLAGEELHRAEYDPRLVRFYMDQAGTLNVQTKRGCPHGCAYCSYPLIEGRAFRFRPPAAVAEEVERLAREHGVGTVFFTDSVFNDTEGRYLELCEELARRGAPVRWNAYFRPAEISRETLRLLKHSGLQSMELGTDAASDATLAGLGKGFCFADVERFNAACLAEEIPCAHFVIFGGPGETQATVEEGLANLDRLRESVVFAFSGIRIHPDTAIRRRAVREGLLDEADPLLMPKYYFSPAVDQEWMDERITAAFRGRRERIYPPSKGAEQMSVLHRFGYRGQLWDTLVRFKPRRAETVAPEAG